jgi:hypothetical protein
LGVFYSTTSFYKGGLGWIILFHRLFFSLLPLYFAKPLNS